MTEPGTAQLPADISLPGTVVQAEPVTEATGSQVWRVTLDDGRVLAVKFADESADSFGITRRLARREASVLRLKGEQDRYLVASGETLDGSWLATVWQHGPTLWQRWMPVLGGGKTEQAGSIQATRRTASLLNDLHAQGWRHCDLQGSHIFIPDDETTSLIDWAHAQGPEEVQPEVPFRGGYAHLNAPEIASELLVTANTHHVEMTPAAEVYVLGAVLYSGWTRQWPRDYRGANPADLRAPDIYEAIADPATLQPMPGGWPSMAALLAAMLDHHPANRPTMDEVLGALVSQCQVGM
ncbi:hypothetical protein F4553_005105 [Allocatelliglobosispora scoriae]|uniref:Protein kinase domain-containing protein n=1 Tax=Allocatelliglobosispora scoriae TaxID=643052 RepID=A0A841BW53_9ACTN|nr:hypothetical protein [Allocatelliglobosispora scoriae]MBB5871726.1 hypothetical protein [Allocatelliglobosispora scoriae]